MMVEIAEQWRVIRFGTWQTHITRGYVYTWRVGIAALRSVVATRGCDW